MRTGWLFQFAICCVVLTNACNMHSEDTVRVSVADSSSGANANGASFLPRATPDGRYVVFLSTASNLVPNDNNGQLDVFVLDNVSGTIARANLSSAGVEGGAGSNAGSSDAFPMISADGRYVAFVSGSTNLVGGDTNGVTDVFVRDMVLGTTSRVSVASDGSQANGLCADISMSADGRYVAFVSFGSNLVPGDTNGFLDVFVRDLQSGTTVCASVAPDGSPADFNSNNPSLSADGRYLAFQSLASNLVAGDTNSQSDIFVRDLQTGITTRMPGSAGFAHRPSISADGKVVAYINGSNASVYNFNTNTTTNVNVDSNGVPGNSSCDRVTISPNGQFVVFASFSSNLGAVDTNNITDVFLHDLQTHVTTPISVTPAGVAGNSLGQFGTVTADGSTVFFYSASSNLVSGDTNSVEDIFVRDVVKGITTRISVAPPAQAAGASSVPSISADGQRVAFASTATNLVGSDANGVSDIFVRDLETGTNLRVSVSSANAEGDGASSSGMISANGKFVAFTSAATNLVAGDTNAVGDVFVRDLDAGTTTRVSVATAGTEANTSSITPRISGDGRFVVFATAASNLSASDTNGQFDVYVRDRQSGTTTLVSVGLDGMAASGSEPAISANGRYVGFRSGGSNIVASDTNNSDDVFVRDLQTNSTVRASLGNANLQANSTSQEPALSSDGRFVVFRSTANNLAANDGNGREDAFLRDLQTGTTTHVSVSPDGAVHNGNTARGLGVSDDGRYVVFNSDAPNLAVADTNGAEDVFVRDLQVGMTRRVSVSSDNIQAGGVSQQAAITPDGVFVVFQSAATNLIPNDNNSQPDVFRTRPHTPTQLLVINTLDPIPGDPPIPGSLRAALQAAQSRDTIVFDSQVFGTQQSNASTVISVFSPLPAMDDGFVAIDGKNRRVTVNGTAAGTASGLVLTSRNNTIQGLALTGFTRSGISILTGSKNNVIGGDRAKGDGPNGEGLRIANCGAFGIEVAGVGTDFNTVQGCWIGLEASGLVAAQNLAGILLRDGARKNVIGSTVLTQANVIAGNSFEGVTVSGAGTDENEIIGNIVGAAAVETASNRSVSSRENEVFLTRMAVGNGSAGVFLSRGTKDSRVGAKDSDADGVASSMSNLIANNGGTGMEVRASESKRNSSRRNRITRNISGGIKLFDGSNDGIKPPRFDVVSRTTSSSLSRAVATVDVKGSADSDGTVEVFSDSGEQGGTFVKRCSVSGGTWQAVIDISDVENMTATFTDLNGNTSPFAFFGRSPALPPDNGGGGSPGGGSGGTVGTGDTDGDGVADVLENLAGTNPALAGEKPVEKGAAVMDTFALTLNFAKPNSDALKVALRLSLPDGYVQDGAVYSVLIGGHVESNLVLNAKGSSPKANTTLKVTKSTVGSGAKLALAVKKGALTTDLGESFGNRSTQTTGEVFTIPSAVVIQSGGVKFLYVGEIEVLYKATQGKSGKAKNAL